MNIKKLIILFLLLCPGLINNYLHAGNLDIWSHLSELNHEFSEQGHSELNHIENRKNSAERVILRAEENIDLNELRSGFSELLAAGIALYNLYDKYCEIARNNMPPELPPELDRIKELETDAKDKINKHLIINNLAEEYDDFKKVRDLYFVAWDLQQLALLSKGRALRVYQDYPTLYSYSWYNDRTILKETHPPDIVSVIDPKKRDDITAPDQIDEPYDDTGDLMQGLKYIIQLAAHTNEIPASKLRSIYGGDMEIKTLREDGWYKYYIGPFSAFEIADSVINSQNLSNAFIAAYYNGERISIGRALELDR